jgi:putative aminopeptidase FrvX
MVAPMDEPGDVVSGITPDGYLRVQRLPQAQVNSVFDLLHAAQPAWVITRNGKTVPGVFAGLSIHLQPLRMNAPKMSHPDEMYVDIGATSAEEVRAAGVDVLDAVTASRSLYHAGATSWVAEAIGDRFGCVTLVEVLGRLQKTKVHGTVTIAFVAQQSTGGRGLDRLLHEVSADEMIYVGGLVPIGNSAATVALGQRPKPGDGIVMGVSDSAAPLTGLPAELKKLADENQLPIALAPATPPRISSYSKPSALPGRFAQLSIPTLFPRTPAETIHAFDAERLEQLLYVYASRAAYPKGGEGQGISLARTGPELLGELTETYGASGHEELVRMAVQRRLPSWAKTQSDAAGNLLVHLGNGPKNAQRIAFVAHLDEIGYQLRSIEADGRLLVDVLGGGFTEYFLGHPVLIHSTQGGHHQITGGVLEPPNGWEQAGFEWPHGPKTLDEPAHVYVGTRSAPETEKLGLKAGDWITIPKQYRSLLGTRANARSFDDRVGCAALIEAVAALGAELPGRDVTFVWSTEEEVGLKGAAVLAERLAKEGRTPDFVFAIDTFVSSDSPLESKRFADAEIGKGFVIRAVDNSNITPREYVERVIKLAHENDIPVQYGVTGGGNDGAVFQRYGSVDIPLGWPLRYSHSPGEVIDTRDVDALARIIAVLAKSW